MDELPPLLTQTDIRVLIESALKARLLQSLEPPTEDDLREMCLWVHRMAYWALLIKASLTGKMLIDVSPGGAEVRFMINPSEPDTSDPETHNPLVSQIEDLLQGYDWNETEG